MVQVVLGDHRVGGGAFATRLDGAMGYGVVRSSRFEARERGATIILSGAGIGHGVGLCQSGAARRASMGEGYRDLLRHYFPEARMGRFPDQGSPSGGPPADGPARELVPDRLTSDREGWPAARRPTAAASPP